MAEKIFSQLILVPTVAPSTPHSSRNHTPLNLYYKNANNRLLRVPDLNDSRRREQRNQQRYRTRRGQAPHRRARPDNHACTTATAPRRRRIDSTNTTQQRPLQIEIAMALAEAHAGRVDGAMFGRVGICLLVLCVRVLLGGWEVEESSQTGGG
ncbi:uncharacterized protein IWZ02DRAFT_442233 [Phyllosticta citriasiana]|uniref:uncharacterized protein n=1 Tax=Phyllosticta citriasiana TaxID=595635 RepID=UPI0030FDB285